jgi:glycosyltransferase involved in cell wall biosynthesis
MSLVSVIIPTYKRNETLFGRALPSVLNQTYPDVEVHIVADGMIGPEWDDLTDRFYRLNQSSRVYLWRIKRQQYPDNQHLRWGLSGLEARNYGLDRATGPFVAALDDDDEMYSNAIARLLPPLISGKSDFSYGMSETFKNGQSIGQLYGRFPPGDGALCNGAYVYRANLPYRFDVNCFDRGLTGDADMWTRMWNGGVRFSFLPEIVHRYHRNFP